jgi:hypothetical protein
MTPVRSGRCGPSSTSSPVPSWLSSSAPAGVAGTTSPRTLRPSSSDISSGCSSAWRARRDTGSPTESCSQQRVAFSHVTAGSPSSSPRRRSSDGIASLCGGSGPIAGQVSRAGHRSSLRSVRSSSALPGRTRAGAASGSRASCAKIGIRVGATTIRTLLRAARRDPAPPADGPTWSQFLQAQAHGIIACDFFTVETAWLRTLYVLVFIELGIRRIHVSPSTAHPDSAGRKGAHVRFVRRPHWAAARAAGDRRSQ